MQRPIYALACASLLLGGLFGLLTGPAWSNPLPEAKIVINVPSRTLWLYSGETVVRSYPVGVGQAAYPTPLGRFEVIRKVEDPVFENPHKRSSRFRRVSSGPKNPLGTRWIGFKEDNGGEYGIHGTNDPASVGKFSSHGCVRMAIRDSEELFDLVDFGTPVEVVYDVALYVPAKDDVKLVVYPDVMGLGLPNAVDLKRRLLKMFPQAEIDEKNLAQALKQPTETPVVVGKNIPAAVDAGAEMAPGFFRLRISN